MAQHASVTSITSARSVRTPPPGDETVSQRAAREHYEADDSGRYTPVTVAEKAVIAHLRGWVHFGPLCPLCGAR